MNEKKEDLTLDLKALKEQESRKRISKGYMWALFCAVFWGIWYLPGTVIWVLNPFDCSEQLRKQTEMGSLL
ncbi:transmembrane protein MttP [Methanosarcina acetivorans C2A]|uniref:Transmembrane protein MttP n=1 Tax=Methanosarcina acetivorans (strain ATCC 35395 / DSM 2834 / JCM 12185 / C2A) TaxID=188937 RepID=Q8TS75_METAC|nr:transmembrane protein MttP [Methanosarcina acetivorans C2A]